MFRLLIPGGLFEVVELAKHATRFGLPMSHNSDSPEELREALLFWWPSILSAGIL